MSATKEEGHFYFSLSKIRFVSKKFWRHNIAYRFRLYFILFRSLTIIKNQRVKVVNKILTGSVVPKQVPKKERGENPSGQLT